MKIRNKRLMTILVTAFAVVFMAGSAFAFTMRGPLVFQGTANVNALLELSIVEVTNEPAQSVLNRYNATAVVIHPYAFAPGNKLAMFEVGFTRPTPQLIFEFRVENTGSMPAVITGVDISKMLDGMPLADHPDYAFWSQTTAHGIPFSVVAHLWSTDEQNWSNVTDEEGRVLQPGESSYVRASVRFLSGWGAADLPLIDRYEIVAQFQSTLSLAYAPYLG